jgi:hypothetical protein
MSGKYRSVPKKSFTCRLPQGEAARRELLANYKRAARVRNLVWEISNDEFTALINSNCEYCGIPPTRSAYGGVFNGKIFYNGIDRLDSKVGYTTANTVAACFKCNRAKNVMNKQEFLEWIHRVATHLKLGLAHQA